MITLFGSKVGKEELEEIKTSIDNQWLGIGKKCARFEEEMWNRLKVQDFVMLNSGSNALLLAVKLLGLPPNSEIILPSFTWIACGHAVVLNGCTPVFCDVDLGTQNVTRECIEPHITKKTKAIMVVHYAGKPVSLDPILKLGFPVIEDAAHAIDSKIGERYCGTMGDIGIYSFDAVKNLSIGEAGGLSSDDAQYTKRARLLRYCGIGQSAMQRSSVTEKRWWEYEIEDFFPKVIPSDIEGSIGLAQIKKLDTHQKRRKEIWDFYQNALKNVSWLINPTGPGEDEQHSYFTYLIRLKNNKRDALARYLYQNGIYTSLRFHPLHLNRIYESDSKLPNCELLSETALNIPLHPNLSDDDVCKIVESIKVFEHTAVAVS
jgi:aminotransferase